MSDLEPNSGGRVIPSPGLATPLPRTRVSGATVVARFFWVVPVLVGTVACAPMSGGAARRLTLTVGQMSDLALIQEIQVTDAKLAQLGVSAQYLAATRPAPTYTLTGTSLYTGTFWRYGNMGQFTFQGQSISQLTPNYGAQLGYAIGQAILAARINNTLPKPAKPGTKPGTSEPFSAFL